MSNATTPGPEQAPAHADARSQELDPGDPAVNGQPPKPQADQKQGQSGGAAVRSHAWPVTLLILRTVGALVVMGLVYAWVPIEGLQGRGVALGGLFVLIVFGVNLAWQLHRISKSRYPLAEGGLAVASVAVVSVLAWALVYLSLSDGSPNAFNVELDKVSAYYFAVTVLGTVGFGDIHAVTRSAMLLVSAQILTNLLIVTAALRLVFAAGQRVASARSSGAPGPLEQQMTKGASQSGTSNGASGN